MSASTKGYEYAGEVTATVRLPRPEYDGPTLVFVETEHLGYFPLTVDQASRLSATLWELVESLRLSEVADAGQIAIACSFYPSEEAFTEKAASLGMDSERLTVGDIMDLCRKSLP